MTKALQLGELRVFVHIEILMNDWDWHETSLSASIQRLKKDATSAHSFHLFARFDYRGSWESGRYENALHSK